MTYSIEIEARLTTIKNCINLYEEQIQEEQEDLKRTVPELCEPNDGPYSSNLLPNASPERQALAEQKLSAIKETFASMTETVNELVTALLREFPELEDEEIEYHGYNLTNPSANYSDSPHLAR